MKIKNMRKPNEEGQWGKVKAFFDVENSGFEMKGFRIIEGINGLFVSMPSQKGKNQQGDDEWFDTVWIEKELRDQLNQIALNEYGSQYDQTLSGEQPVEKTVEETEEAIPVTDAPSSMANGNSEKNMQPFSDDDIPF